MSKLGVVAFDRGEPLFDSKKVNLCIADEFVEGNLILRKTRKMNENINKAREISEECLTLFNASLNNLVKKESDIAEASKKASGNVRKAANELAEGLARIEKTANFNNLERYVSLLERAASALSTLAELEKTGHLNKISSALK